MHVLASPSALRGEEGHLMVLVAKAAIAILRAIWTVRLTIYVDIIEDNIVSENVFGVLLPDLRTKA